MTLKQLMNALARRARKEGVSMPAESSRRSTTSPLCAVKIGVRLFFAGSTPEPPMAARSASPVSSPTASSSPHSSSAVPLPPNTSGTVFVPLFQRWIRDGELPHEQLIDVVRYRHVKDGPWVMLVGVTSHFTIDGRGLVYSRRRSGSKLERFRSACATVVDAALRIEAETPFRFDADVLELTIDDRLLAPNTLATFETVEDEIRACPLLADAVIVPASGEDRTSRPCRLRIRLREPRSLSALLDVLRGLEGM